MCKKCLTPKPARARMASLIDETATARPASVSNQAKKVLDRQKQVCETGFTDSSSTGDSQQNQAKKRLTRNQSCAKLASLIQATQQHRQHRKSSKKVLDRQKQVCETGFTERNATTGSKSSKKVLDSRNEACKTGSTEQTNPGTARRASLKEHYHDCNHQKRPG